MTKFVIPSILAVTILIAGIFAFMPVEKAATVHTTITAGIDALAPLTVTLTPLASAARTASGVSTAQDTDDILPTALVRIDVTVVSGTSPTLDVTLRDTLSAATLPGASGTLTATGMTIFETVVTDSVEVVFTIGGTSPSFTFEVELIGKTVT